MDRCSFQAKLAVRVDRHSPRHCTGTVLVPAERAAPFLRAVLWEASDLLAPGASRCRAVWLFCLLLESCLPLKGPSSCEPLLVVRPRIQSIKRNYRNCKHKPLLLLAIPVFRWAFEASFAGCSLLVSTFYPFACQRLHEHNLRSSGSLICHSNTESQENLPRCSQEPADSCRTSIIFMSQSCHIIVLKSYFIADL